MELTTLPFLEHDRTLVSYDSWLDMYDTDKPVRTQWRGAALRVTRVDSCFMTLSPMLGRIPAFLMTEFLIS